MIPFKVTEVPGCAFDLYMSNPGGGAVALKDGVIYTFTKAQVQRAFNAALAQIESSQDCGKQVNRTEET